MIDVKQCFRSSFVFPVLKFLLTSGKPLETKRSPKNISP